MGCIYIWDSKEKKVKMTTVTTLSDPLKLYIDDSDYVSSSFQN